MTRFVDISMAISATVITDPPPLVPKISYTDHSGGLAQMLPFFPGLTAEDLPDGKAWAVEDIALTTHSGTHMDAPYHFHPTTYNGASRATAIDEAPLDLFLRPGVKLDFRHLPDGHIVSAAEIDAELARIGHELQPFDIVLMNTSAAAHYGNPDFFNRGCGFGAEATLHLTARGVRVVGTDAWSWDAPFSFIADRFAKTGDASIIWEGHKAGRVRPYYQMEKLQNLDALPGHGFTVACFPVKIERASAGWVRAVAIFEEASPA